MLTVSPKTIIKTSIKLALLPNNFVADKILGFSKSCFSRINRNLFSDSAIVSQN